MSNEYDTSEEPLGSRAVKVLYNNASNLDDAVNDVESETWVDRPPFNRVRKTLFGYSQDFNRFLVASGFEVQHLTYTDGVPLQVDRASQFIDRAGLVYRVKLPANFPVMLSGNWATDQTLLLDVGDQSLRVALANSSDWSIGAGLVGRAIRHINSPTELDTLAGRYNGDIVYYVGVPNANDMPFNTGYDHFKWVSGTAYARDGYLIFGTTPSGRWVRQVTTNQQTLPAALSAWLPANTKVYGTGSLGRAYTTLNVEALWKTQEVGGIVNYYVDGVNGLDSNNGAVNAPFKTISAAIAAGSVGVIWVKPGTYYESLGNVIGTTVQRDIQIRTFTGNQDVLIRNTFDPAALVWTLETGSTYKATISSTVYRVLDLSLTDVLGDRKDFKKQTSIANVNANPGSWYYDSGTGIVYVRRFSNTAPGSDILIPKASTNCQINANRALFLRNLTFEGGGGLTALTDGTSRPRFYLLNCIIKYAANDGVRTLGGSCYSQGCIVARSGLDNFNYHDSGSLLSRAVEIDCVSYGAGDLAAKGDSVVGDTQNASSMHDAGSVLRVNGRYYESYGPVIPDTTSAVSYNVGVECFNSVGLTTQNVTWYANGDMTLIDCSSRGSTTDAKAEGAGVIKIRNFMSQGVYSGAVVRI